MTSISGEKKIIQNHFISNNGPASSAGGPRPSGGRVRGSSSSGCRPWGRCGPFHRAVHRDGFPRAGALADATAHTGVGADLWGLGEHPFAQLAGGPGQGPQKLHQVALDAAGEAVVVHPQGLQRLAQQLHLLNVAGPQAPALRGQQNRIGGQRQSDEGRRPPRPGPGDCRTPAALRRAWGCRRRRGRPPPWPAPRP